MFTRTELESADDWQEYNTGNFTAGVDLRRKGVLPRLIVMKEAGALYCTNAAGAPCTLTGLPAWYSHFGKVASILPAQTAAIVVYW